MKRPRDTRACAPALSYYVPRQQIPHRRVIPSPTARRADTASVQRRGDGPVCRSTRRLDLANDRRHIRREGVCRRPVRRRALRLGLAEIGRVAQLRPLRLLLC